MAKTSNLLKTEIKKNGNQITKSETYSWILSLQDMVTRHFFNIPSNDLPGDDFSAYTHDNAFQSKFYQKVYFVKPIENISRIDITWCLDPIEVAWHFIPISLLIKNQQTEFQI